MAEMSKDLNQLNYPQKEDKFTFEDADKIRNSLTEDRFLILNAIYHTPHIQHKALCQQLNKKPNNLSNMIKKISEIDYDLILTHISGTEKYYSLTDIAKQYVELELHSNKLFSRGDEQTRRRSAETAIEKTLKTLQLFKEKCGPDWRTVLNSLLSGEKTEADNAEIQNVYDDLTAVFCDYRRKDAAILEQIFEALEDEALTGQITEYLDRKFVYFDFMKPLLIPGGPDYSTQFMIIDSVFAELHPYIFVPSQYEKLPESLLSSEEYNNLLLGITKLSREFIDIHHTKSAAVTNWKTYFLTEELAFYIAEKCSLLMFLCRFLSCP